MEAVKLPCTAIPGDEIGIMVNSFRKMMDEINRLIDEVYVNKIALKEYELKALQAQINPHFLYNTLSMMNWMAIRSNQMEHQQGDTGAIYFLPDCIKQRRGCGDCGKLYPEYKGLSGNTACDARS